MTETKKITTKTGTELEIRLENNKLTTTIKGYEWVLRTYNIHKKAIIGINNNCDRKLQIQVTKADWTDLENWRNAGIRKNNKEDFEKYLTDNNYTLETYENQYINGYLAGKIGRPDLDGKFGTYKAIIGENGKRIRYIKAGETAEEIKQAIKNYHYHLAGPEREAE